MCIRDRHGDDVQEWFRKIGFVLSPSEFESFHMAIPEGMASGAIPVIRNWEGADQIYPKRFIFKDITQAASIILKYQDEAKRTAEAARLKKWSKQHFGLDVILGQYEQLFKEVLDRQQITITSPQLRGIYDQLQQEQAAAIESLTKKDMQAAETIKELKKQTTEKENQLAKLRETDKTNRQTIEKLNHDVAERISKLDAMIAVADEMKLQLTEGRLREKEKDKQIQSHREKDFALRQEVLNLKTNIRELQTQIKSIESENKTKDRTIAELQKVVESMQNENALVMHSIAEKDNQIADKDNQITEKNRKIAEKDARLAETGLRMEALRNELHEWMGKSEQQLKLSLIHISEPTRPY